MGFNPLRKRRPRPGDVAIVAITLALAAGLVLWATLAGR